jgi:putative ATPase
LRGSDPDGALYWGFRMLEAGEDPRFIIRRMIIFASEDIGNADPQALTLAVSTAQAFDRVGLPEGKIPIAHCITYLATAPKSNRSYMAMHKVIDAIKENPRAEVPLHLRNAPTQMMKDLDYGKDYQYPHDYENSLVEGVVYLPEPLKSRKFY